jgi:hypothetical protein
MQDPKDLLKRAAELSEGAEAENAPQTRERLQDMAALYRRLADSEQELADNPTSITSVGDLFKS